eukprot:COSAG06_NODE_51619_length_311_cov_0.514151_1_plen_69_part_01
MLAAIVLAGVAMCATTLLTAGATGLPPGPDPAAATFPSHLGGSVDAAAALLERVLPGSASHFELAIEPH